MGLLALNLCGLRLKVQTNFLGNSKAREQKSSDSRCILNHTPPLKLKIYLPYVWSKF
jgi:hypothetical protein